MDCPPIPEFYAHRSILVTGGTGFVGKVLIEKLLRSCPNIAHIYLLVRVKTGGQIQDRIQEIINTPVFEYLKQNQPHLFEKLVPVSGDVTLPGLGLSDADVDVLKNQITVVFHVAARIKFDRELKEAVDINIKGTRRIVELCHQLPHLKALVHVSTCYIHLDKNEINEVIYSPPIEPQKLIDLVDSASPAELEALIKTLLAKCPNVYACTKAVSEYLLREEGSGLPLAIVRPSIVTASFREPMAGWIDNLNGPTGMMVGVAHGFLRALRYDPDVVGDLIPVDYVTNLMIAAAWNTANSAPGSLNVYNCSTGHLNPITWSQFKTECFKSVANFPPQGMVWYPSVSGRSNYYVNQIENVVYHYIPAYIVDTFARLSGKRPKMVRLYDKAHRMLNCLSFYTTQEWRFTTENLVRLNGQMTEEDRQTFDFDVRLINWSDYLAAYARGTRQYIMKEDLSNIELGKRKLVKMYWIRLIFHLILFALFCFVLSLIFQWSRADQILQSDFKSDIAPLLHFQSPLKR